MKEIWRDISTYKDYQVSNIGRVKYKSNVIKPSTSAEGYLTVSLRCHHQSKNQYVHRLVAQAFIPNPHDLPAVNHKNEDKSDDRVGNLEWCTIHYNACYGSNLWKQARARFFSIKISNHSISKTFPSMKAANFWLRAYGGVNRSKYTIQARLSRCCWGQCQTVFGYQARFIIRKGSSWQLSLFNKPRQTSLFGRD